MVPCSVFRVQGSWFTSNLKRENRNSKPSLRNLNPESQTRIELCNFKVHHRPSQREFFIDNLLVRIHFVIQMVLVDRPCAMGVRRSFSMKPNVCLPIAPHTSNLQPETRTSKLRPRNLNPTIRTCTSSRCATSRYLKRENPKTRTMRSTPQTKRPSDEPSQGSQGLLEHAVGFYVRPMPAGLRPPHERCGTFCSSHPWTREVGNLLPNNQRQRRTCNALCHILYPVSAAHTSIYRMDSFSACRDGRIQ